MAGNKGDNRKVIVSVNIERSADKQLKKFADKYKTSKSAIARICLENGLSKL